MTIMRKKNLRGCALALGGYKCRYYTHCSLFAVRPQRTPTPHTAHAHATYCIYAHAPHYTLIAIGRCSWPLAAMVL